MISILQTILTNILKAIYEPFGFAVLLAIFFMFFYLFAKATSWKRAVNIWLEMFRKSSEFRKMFLFVFYVALMLFRTLLNRSIWSNPLSNVMGGWGLNGDDGKLSTEAVENVFLFIPYILLLFWTFSHKLWKTRKVTWMLASALGISFGTSLGIEFLQLLPAFRSVLQYAGRNFGRYDLCDSNEGQGSVEGKIRILPTLTAFHLHDKVKHNR